MKLAIFYYKENFYSLVQISREKLVFLAHATILEHVIHLYFHPTIISP